MDATLLVALDLRTLSLGESDKRSLPLVADATLLAALDATLDLRVSLLDGKDMARIGENEDTFSLNALRATFN